MTRASFQRWLVSLFCGAGGALTVVESTVLAPEVLRVTGWALLLVGSGLAYVLLKWIIEPGWRHESPGARRAWVLGSWGVAALLVLMIPLELGGWTNSLEIRTTGRHHPGSRGNEVWVRVVDGAGPRSLEQFSREGDWQKRDGQLLSNSERPTWLRLRSNDSRGVTVTFVAHAWSGIVEVTWNGVRQELDLFQEESGWRVLELKSPEMPLGDRALRLAIFAVPLGLLVLTLGVWLTARPARVRSAPPKRWTWALYALPCLLTWSLWWLAFWPGLMSSDSVDQWYQMQVGRYEDVHPVFHTSSNWLLTRLWPSPAAVASVQLLALSCTVGWCLSTLRRYGASRAGTAGLCVLLALSPINGVTVITLWKDVPYSITLLLLSGLLVHVFFTQGGWLRERSSVLALGIVSALAALYRHNGFAAVVGMGAGLLLAYPLQRRSTLTALLLGLGLWKGTQVVLDHTFKVEHRPWSKLQPLIDQIGAHVAAGTPMTPEEHAFLETVRPLEVGWPYACDNHSTYVFDGKLHLSVIDAHPDALVGLWWNLLRRAPRVNLEHILCSGALVWRITTGSSYLYTSAIITTSAGQVHPIEPNTQGLEWRPVLPTLAPPLLRLLSWTEAPQQVWWLWRPALYLLGLLASVGVLALRTRSVRALLLAVPTTFHSALMLLVTPNEDFRFQYGVYLVALLFAGTLLLGRLPCTSPPADPATPRP